MKKRPVIVLGGVLIAASGRPHSVAFFLPAQEAVRRRATRGRKLRSSGWRWPRRSTGSERGFTGIIAARVQSNLGFRVAGKIVERLVDVGQQVKAGQPLMRIDETDLRLALMAKRNAVAAARAVASFRRGPMRSAMPARVKAVRCPAAIRAGQGRARIRPRRSSPPPKPKRASPKTKRPIRLW